MSENWKKFVDDFIKKNEASTAVKDHPLDDIPNLNNDDTIKRLKLFWYLSKQPLKWFQEEWRDWRGGEPAPKFRYENNHAIPLRTNYFFGNNNNEKELWLFDCVFKLHKDSLDELWAIKLKHEPEESEEEQKKLDINIEGAIKMEQRVFIIHGHDGGANGLRRKISELLREAKVAFEILEDVPSIGTETVLEKLVRVAKTCTYAIALFTKDDLTHDGQYRARQNVLLETGYFMGYLGRENVTLANIGTEIPSDLNGVLYIRPLAEADWGRELLEILENAHFEVDNGVWRQINRIISL